MEPESARITGGAMGWTGVDMPTPLCSGWYLFVSKNDIKHIRYTF